MANRSDFMAGFILGGLLGTALALLFAPRTGEETRDRLWDSTEEARDRARERADEVLKKVRNAADDVAARSRSKLDESASRLREAIDHGREVFEEKTREFQNREERPEG